MWRGLSQAKAPASPVLPGRAEGGRYNVGSEQFEIITGGLEDQVAKAEAVRGTEHCRRNLRWEMCRAYGACVYVGDRYPALAGWAKLRRAAGAWDEWRMPENAWGFLVADTGRSPGGLGSLGARDRRLIGANSYSGSARRCFCRGRYVGRALRRERSGALLQSIGPASQRWAFI